MEAARLTRLSIFTLPGQPCVNPIYPLSRYCSIALWSYCYIVYEFRAVGWGSCAVRRRLPHVGRATAYRGGKQSYSVVCLWANQQSLYSIEACVPRESKKSYPCMLLLKLLGYIYGFSAVVSRIIGVYNLSCVWVGLYRKCQYTLWEMFHFPLLRIGSPIKRVTGPVDEEVGKRLLK